MTAPVISPSSIAHAPWCVDGACCDAGTSCLSESDDRVVRCTGGGTWADANGDRCYLQARVYLQRNVGWAQPGMPGDAVSSVHLNLVHEGWTGGEDAGLTVEEARALAALLLDCADRASVDRASLLAAGHRADVSRAPEHAWVLLSLPPDALAGLSLVEREEAISAAKATLLEQAREIPRRLDQG